MPWVQRVAAMIVHALHAAHADDEFFPAFHRRVEAVLEGERPPAAQPPPATWDRPSEQTVRLLPKAQPGATAVAGAGRGRSARG